jgi:hypothetical protein
MLDRRALNRALLARQWLLDRQAASAVEGIEQLVGMQAQAPNSPYVGLWTRLVGFAPEDLSELIMGRRVVRIALMRGTIHLVSAGDALELRPLVQPVLDRALKANYGKRLQGLALSEVAAAGRLAVAQDANTPGQLGARLREQWPDRDADALANAVRNLVPLVQVPPRGVWGSRARTTYATAEDWLGRSLTAEPSSDRLVLRYLAAFGPASVRDMQAWSGLTRLTEVFERLRPTLMTFRDPGGRELFDHPDGPRPDPDTPASARLLAEFDNVLLAHADRSRIVTEEHRRKVMTANGLVLGSLLIDGFVAGTWRIARRAGAVTLLIQPFVRLSVGDRDATAAEGDRLLAFVEGGEGTGSVEFSPPA